MSTKDTRTTIRQLAKEVRRAKALVDVREDLGLPPNYLAVGHIVLRQMLLLLIKGAM